MEKTKPNILVFGFLLIQAVLYGFILTSGGNLLVICEYTAVVLCFLFTLINIKRGDMLLTAGLAFTVVADYFLVASTNQQKLWGMIAFLFTQTCYAVKLHRIKKEKAFLFIRALLTVFAIALTFGVLGNGADILAVVSVCYYANLILNIIMAFFSPKTRFLAVGLVLFLLCDTVIGLQVAAGGYLSIAPGTALYKLIFAPFNLAWAFYLPSQVIISLSAGGFSLPLNKK